MSALVEYAKHGTVGVLTVNNPPVNALSIGVPEGMADGLIRGVAGSQIEALSFPGDIIPISQ